MTMKLAKGAVGRVNTGEKNLILRNGPGAQHKWLATIRSGVLVRLLSDSVNGWAQAEINGHTLDGRTIYSDPDERSSIEATRGRSAWQQIALTGYVSIRYLVVIDGPA
jgi:hypothetical protein